MFIERVKLLLKEKKIFAKDMLLDLGINKNQMSRWEKEGTLPKPIVLNSIANYLGTTPEYLLGETDIKTPSQLPQGGYHGGMDIKEKPSEQTEDDELIAECIEALKKLKPNQIKRGIKYLKFLENDEE